MSESSLATEPTKTGLSRLTLWLAILVAVLVVVGGVLSPISGQVTSGMETVIDTILTLATDVIYLIGGTILVYGALFVTIRFIQSKLNNPNKPSAVSRYLSGYLTLSLEFFIGAEIIRTVVTRTYQDFELLLLIILSRGLFSFILYLERRWHGAAETE